MNKNTDETPKKGGYGAMKGNETGRGFEHTGQPSPEAKRQGWLNKKRGIELAKAILSLTMEGKGSDELKRSAAEYFNLPLEEITVEALLILKQAEKAIKKADTQAFNSIMDRAYGKPMNKSEITGRDGKDLLPSGSIDEAVKGLTTEELRSYIDTIKNLDEKGIERPDLFLDESEDQE